ncbi:MAG: hypothetical protein R3F61_23445 [Myxococcota bacterium]
MLQVLERWSVRTLGRPAVRQGRPVVRAVDLLRLGPAERAELLDRVERLFSEFFPGGGGVRAFCTDPLATHVLLRLAEVDGVLEGCSVYRRDDLTLDGTDVAVHRGYAAMRPRGRGNVTSSYTPDIVRYLFSPAGRRRVSLIFGRSFTPATYLITRRYCPSVYPRPGDTQDPEQEALARRLCELYGFELCPSEPGAPLVSPHARSQEFADPEARARAAASDHPDVRFYLEHCPLDTDRTLVLAGRIEARMALGVLRTALRVQGRKALRMRS